MVICDCMYIWVEQDIRCGFGRASYFLRIGNVSREDKVYYADGVRFVLECKDSWTRLACALRWANICTCIQGARGLDLRRRGVGR